jgi:hypothetical protein
LRLLYLHTGFEIEDVLGDYNRRPLRASSQLMIMIGMKPAGGERIQREGKRKVVD